MCPSFIIHVLFETEANIKRLEKKVNEFKEDYKEKNEFLSKKLPHKLAQNNFCRRSASRSCMQGESINIRCDCINCEVFLMGAVFASFTLEDLSQAKVATCNHNHSLWFVKFVPILYCFFFFTCV